MIRVFPSLEHSGGACPHSARQFVGLLCSTYLCSRKKHNRAKPMSELPSALFSIADGSEFRFTRFYIVCEAVPLGAPESPLIVCGFAGHTPGTVQTWKDTEPDVRRGTEEILGFCFKELPPLVAFWNFIFSNILIIKHIPFQIFLVRR